jgi:hypothetical protein
MFKFSHHRTFFTLWFSPFSRRNMGRNQKILFFSKNDCFIDITLFILLLNFYDYDFSFDSSFDTNDYLRTPSALRSPNNIHNT